MVHDWCTGWSSNKVTLEDIWNYMSQLLSTGRQADTQGSIQLHEKSVHRRLNYRRRTVCAICTVFSKFTLKINQHKVLVRRNPAANAPMQRSGTTKTYSICTNWYARHLQYRHQRNVLVRYRPTVLALTYCSGTTYAYSISSNAMFWYDTGLQYRH